MGGGDIETAKSVAERANKTMHTIYDMPIGYEWVFRRGDMPVYTKIIDMTQDTREEEQHEELTDEELMQKLEEMVSKEED